MSEFDFSALSAAPAELPKREGGKPPIVQNNPFVDWVQQSYADFKAGKPAGRKVTVPNEQVKRTMYLIRQAAEKLGVGVRIVCSLDDEARKKAARNKNVDVMFQGKEKRAYSERKKSEAVEETTPAPEATE